MTHKPRTTLSSASDIEMSKSDDVEERVQTKSGLDECRLWPEHIYCASFTFAVLKRGPDIFYRV